jgi:hypothetical protein
MRYQIHCLHVWKWVNEGVICENHGHKWDFWNFLFESGTAVQFVCRSERKQLITDVTDTGFYG